MGGADIPSDEFTPEHLVLLQEETGLALPSDSRGLRMVFENGGAVAKVSIPKDVENDFASQLEGLALENVSISGSLSLKTDWWPAERSDDLAEASYWHGTGVKLGIHARLRREEDGTILYVEWYAVDE